MLILNRDSHTFLKFTTIHYQVQVTRHGLPFNYRPIQRWLTVDVILLAQVCSSTSSASYSNIHLHTIKFKILNTRDFQHESEKIIDSFTFAYGFIQQRKGSQTKLKSLKNVCYVSLCLFRFDLIDFSIFVYAIETLLIM